MRCIQWSGCSLGLKALHIKTLVLPMVTWAGGFATTFSETLERLRTVVYKLQRRYPSLRSGGDHRMGLRPFLGGDDAGAP